MLGSARAGVKARRVHPSFHWEDLGGQRRACGSLQQADPRMEPEQQPVRCWRIRPEPSVSAAPAPFCVSFIFQHEGRSAPLDLSAPQRGTTHTHSCTSAHSGQKDEGIKVEKRNSLVS